MMSTAGSARWDEKKEDGWKERMDDWKLQQGNLGPEPDEDADADMYASCTAFQKTMFIQLLIMNEIIYNNDGHPFTDILATL